MSRRARGAVVRRLEEVLLIAAFVAAAAPLVVFPVGDEDAWWHLRTGEWILEHAAVPRTDPFSATAYGQPWVTHEWLFEVGVAVAYRLGGIGGVLVLKGALVAALFAILFRWARRRGHPVGPALVLLLPLGFLAAERFTVRPQIVTYMCFAAVLTTLLDFRDLGRDRLLRLPAIFLVWANSHSGFVFGLGALGLFLVGRWIAERGLDRRLLAVSAASLAATLLNPNGFEALRYPFRLASDPAYRGAIADLQPIFHPAFAGRASVAAFVGVAVLAIAAVAWRWGSTRTVDAFSATLATAFALATLLAIRNRALFAVAVYPLLVAPGMVVGRPEGGALARFFRRLDGRPARAVILAVMLGVAFLGYARGVPLGQGRWRAFGTGIDPRVPVEATEFVRRAGLSGPLLHEMRFGGWLLWSLAPDRRVFIDGRNLVYGAEHFDRYTRLLHPGPGWDELADRYAIETVILRNPAAAGFPAQWPPLAAYLSWRDDWALVHFDDVAVVFVRRTDATAAVVDSFEFRIVDPARRELLRHAPLDAAEAGRLRGEIARMESSPSLFPRLAAVRLRAEAGDTAGALAAIRRLEAERPQEATVRRNREVLEKAVAREEVDRKAAGEKGLLPGR